MVCTPTSPSPVRRAGSCRSRPIHNDASVQTSGARRPSVSKLTSLTSSSVRTVTAAHAKTKPRRAIRINPANATGYYSYFGSLACTLRRVLQLDGHHGHIVARTELRVVSWPSVQPRSGCGPTSQRACVVHHRVPVIIPLRSSSRGTTPMSPLAVPSPTITGARPAGHEHSQRFAPVTPTGAADPNGVRSSSCHRRRHHGPFSHPRHSSCSYAHSGVSCVGNELVPCKCSTRAHVPRQRTAPSLTFSALGLAPC